MEAIVAFSDGFGIGHRGRLPWHIPDDLRRFRALTDGHVVIMGRVTFESLPVGGLPGRTIIVVTGAPREDTASVKFRTVDSVYDALDGSRRVFVAGGERIYAHFAPFVDTVHATHVFGDPECDAFFPPDALGGFRLVDAVPCRGHEYLTYARVDGRHQEYAYRDLLVDIRDTGAPRCDRTGTGTRSVFGRQLRFDIGSELPLITGKFVPPKAVIKELLWFCRGETDAKALANQGVKIWEGNTSRDFLDRSGLGHYDVGDIGSMYGFNWRHCGAPYRGCAAKYDGQGTDQLMEVLRLLREDPDSRRICMTTYDPAALRGGVLHPCHGLVTQFYVNNGQLSCHMYQRSADTKAAVAGSSQHSSLKTVGAGASSRT